MLFKNEDTSLKLDVARYEFMEGEGQKGSDDQNWLVMRCTWINDEGDLVKDSNACLLTYELKEMTAGLKVLHAGIRESYESAFVEPYFEVAAQSNGEGAFDVAVSFYLPNTMDGDDTAEVECTMSAAEMKEWINELDELCKKFPDRA